jgi:hypothetical protein
MPRTHTVDFDTAVAIHEASFAVAADRLGIKLRPARFDGGVRRYAVDVVDADPNDATAEADEAVALMMLVADQALEQLAPPARGRDDVEGRELLFRSFQRKHGLNCLKIPSVLREFHIRFARLQTEAAEFVTENAAEIARTAANLAAKAKNPPRNASKPVSNGRPLLASP